MKDKHKSQQNHVGPDQGSVRCTFAGRTQKPTSKCFLLPDESFDAVRFPSRWKTGLEEQIKGSRQHTIPKIYKAHILQNC